MVMLLDVTSVINIWSANLVCFFQSSGGGDDVLIVFWWIKPMDGILRGVTPLGVTLGVDVLPFEGVGLQFTWPLVTGVVSDDDEDDAAVVDEAEELFCKADADVAFGVTVNGE